MLILALDSTACVGTAALSLDRKLLAEYNINTGNTHSETLLPMTESVLKLTGHTVDDIDLFAVTAGPGSFTGVRIGAATVKGLAFARKKPCTGVSAPEVLAYNLIGLDGIYCPVINARRGQVYNALFEYSDGRIKRLCRDRLILITELANELAAINKPVRICGDAYSDMKKALPQAPETPALLLQPRAYSVALAALAHFENGEGGSDCELTPDYLRPSQAEREKLGLPD